jgi:hypothetical protein
MGRDPYLSASCVGLPEEGDMDAGITRMNFPPARADDVVRNIQQDIIPYHRQFRGQGLRRALFLVNRETGEAVGIAVWDDRNKLREVERRHGRDAPAEIRDPARAPTDYTKKRAEAIQNVGGAIASADWYEVVGDL